MECGLHKNYRQERSNAETDTNDLNCHTYPRAAIWLSSNPTNVGVPSVRDDSLCDRQNTKHESAQIGFLR